MEIIIRTEEIKRDNYNSSNGFRFGDYYSTLIYWENYWKKWNRTKKKAYRQARFMLQVECDEK